ncbi:nicotinate-nicotinamide nucleotide adenylyltransferase [Ehrlichia ruminantium]|uniref:nicotinate-nucleotide adenylyltransferase n=1 Tax=Ehrlichia ruminantium TaxID=779 RepID=A0AAE6Q8X7_EHRRU|nr:nicotinate-nicotinamide nucleotide adenylyltransferase [Ehrlichia ruminantium]QGR02367.1 nicotinate-nicotinamide nucleotide adenylyltransferase [Ehrlichia ruminantium]QGR03286.1 nicotinate-nicotinamide nucleotide adenylyltransferase [Ehrlichia ruminantium]QGR04212.1 nicotinate-nicotinamide nucleotide adenylyltransferase [Ehrlichia ruminantium]
MLKRLTIGLLGGSFNPPHYGHMYITRESIKRLKLDMVWWLIVPQNPLKFNGGYDIHERTVLSSKLISGYRRVRIVKVQECYSYNTVVKLQSMFKHINFIWLMGSDNLLAFHLWYRWRDFCKLLPIIVFERTGYVYRFFGTPFVSYMRNMYFVNPQLLMYSKYGWSFIRLRTYSISSSEIRGYSLKKV